MATHDESIHIKVDGGHIAGTVVTPGTLLPGVLFVHGWGGSQEQYLARAREVAALGCICLTFDLRGHAGTEPQRETVSRESNLCDVVAAYDVLARHPGVDRSAIAVVGSSYGGYLGAILTSMRPVRWLALRVPALYIDTGWEVPKLQLHKDQDLESYRRNFVEAADNRALRACAAFRGDVLLVESECDTVVPHPVIASYREACIQAASLTYRVIHGADHGLSQDSAQRAYTALLVNWLSEMVLGARQGGGTPPGPVSGSTVPEAPPMPG
ncbi:alpha/beta fold hydrolase [Aquabacterium sp. A7-Y]|uniref:alpha/beta hydrolase family protein n=1 Tax=Aquabacterium sp. A7-Y TaxID=1349605 RepID=UPI00223D7707|nr:alpha/beta fold hydrolase [Aquabacterium sp. A7-Y]MCW7537885.1 alpha/beta fold hydrolase [Aquabacterium sp. A7-Y]